MSEYEDEWNISFHYDGLGKGRVMLWKDHRAYVARMDYADVRVALPIINQLAADFLGPLPTDVEGKNEPAAGPEDIQLRDHDALCP